MGHGKSMKHFYTHLSNKQLKEAMKIIYDTGDEQPQNIKLQEQVKHLSKAVIKLQQEFNIIKKGEVIK